MSFLSEPSLNYRARPCLNGVQAGVDASAGYYSDILKHGWHFCTERHHSDERSSLIAVQLNMLLYSPSLSLSLAVLSLFLSGKKLLA